MFSVPILLIIYNRAEETHNCFEVLKVLKPSKLYVAGDGADPDKKVDYAKCLRARNVVTPNWECDVKTFYKDEHVGKAQMIFQAINWFFENEPEGIILLDDILPHIDFFYYCEELLERFRHVHKVVHISGANFQKHHKRGDASYYFSAYANTWGFATWKDRWTHFDLKMTELNNVNFNEIVGRYFAKKKERKHWIKWYNVLKIKKLDLWDYQYNFHLWFQDGLCVTPNTNLITNAGFKKNKKHRIRKLMMPSRAILPLTHPEEIVQETRADYYAFKKFYKRAFFTMFADWFNENIARGDKSFN